MLEVASFVISVFALLISTYAIYQVYKSNNMKLSVNDISKRVFNRFYPVFIRFTINNHSSKSITIKSISFEDDKGNPNQTYIDFEPKSRGYEPPKPKPRTVVMGIDITPPSFVFPLLASQPCMKILWKIMKLFIATRVKIMHITLKQIQNQ